MKTHARRQIEETFVRLLFFFFFFFSFTRYWEFFLLNNLIILYFHIIFQYREERKLLEILGKVDSKMLLFSPT